METLIENQTLVCWIGDTDLLALGKFGLDNDIPHFKNIAKIILKKDKADTEHDIDKDIATLDIRTRNSSIVLTIDAALKRKGIPLFSDVILLTNRPSRDASNRTELQEHYPMFLKQACKGFDGNVSVVFVPAENNPEVGVNGWDYEAVLIATRKIIGEKIKAGLNPDSIWYNVTPGTIAQSTTLILLGKELSSNSNFIQVEKSRKRVEKCRIPFDINHVIVNQAAHIEATARGESQLIGKSPSFLIAWNKARQIAQYPVTVLLTGESGTGKEVFAREIHRLSGREGKFVAINCAMLSKETGVTELTGFFRGAFTDAKETTPGKFHEAAGGTLFLDEIGDCPLDVQAELLRFLQPLDASNPSEREWKLKGAEPRELKPEEKKYSGTQHADIRVIAATNRHLFDQSSFRKDLYYRIETIQIKLPGLERRKAEVDKGTNVDDLKELADFFLENSNKAFRLKKKFHKEAYEALRAHEWTGNVRELQNVIIRVTLLAQGEEISAKDIRDNLNNLDDMPCRTPETDLRTIASVLARHDIAKGEATFRDREKAFRQAYCKAALQATGGNKKAAYMQIGLDPKSFEGYITG